ncbi:response regulator [Xanthobacteraceae bacterium A53D]
MRERKWNSCIVVEDDPLVLWVTADFLEMAGYETILVETADEAMNVLRSKSDIAFLLTDIHMPGGMDGLQLAAWAHEQRPSMAIVVTSGRVKPSATALPAGASFLPKPYSFEQLGAALSLSRKSKEVSELRNEG